MGRYRYLNFSKVVCMLCVILSHCMLFYASNPFWVMNADFSTPYAIFFTNIFDCSLISCFVLISGFLLNCSIQKKNKSTPQMIKSRFTRLIIPWFLFCVLWLVPTYTYFDIVSFGREKGDSFFQGYRSMLLGKFADITWFLLLLFWISLIWILLKELLKKDRLVVGFIVAVVLMLVDYYFLGLVDYYKISQLHQYILIFYLGAATYNYIDQIEAMEYKTLLVIDIVISIVAIVGAQFVNGNFYIGVLLKIISAYALLIFGMLLDRKGILDILEKKGAYKWLVTHNMDIFLFQVPWIYLYYSLLYPRIGKNALLCIVCNFVLTFISIVICCTIFTFVQKKVCAVDREN